MLGTEFLDSNIWQSRLSDSIKLAKVKMVRAVHVTCYPGILREFVGSVIELLLCCVPQVVAQEMNRGIAYSFTIPMDPKQTREQQRSRDTQNGVHQSRSNSRSEGQARSKPPADGNIQSDASASDQRYKSYMDRLRQQEQERHRRRHQGQHHRRRTNDRQERGNSPANAEPSTRTLRTYNNNVNNNNNHHNAQYYSHTRRSQTATTASRDSIDRSAAARVQQRGYSTNTVQPGAAVAPDPRRLPTNRNTLVRSRQSPNYYYAGAGRSDAQRRAYDVTDARRRTQNGYYYRGQVLQAPGTRYQYLAGRWA